MDGAFVSETTGPGICLMASLAVVEPNIVEKLPQRMIAMFTVIILHWVHKWCHFHRNLIRSVGLDLFQDKMRVAHDTTYDLRSLWWNPDNLQMIQNHRWYITWALLYSFKTSLHFNLQRGIQCLLQLVNNYFCKWHHVGLISQNMPLTFF